MAIPPVYSRTSDYPSSGLTPEKLTAILREADEGSVRTQMELFEEIEEKDPHIASQMQTRKNAVTGLDWEVIPFSDTPLDKKISAFVDSTLTSLKNWNTVMFDLLDAIGKGIAVSEVIWGYEGGMVIPKEIRHVSQKLLSWDTDDVLRVSTADNLVGVPLVPNKYIIHEYRARSGHPSKAGVLRVCAWMYLFKNYAVKDWVAFAEIYGMPLRLGKYSAGASEEDRKALARALIQLGSDAAGIIPDSADITFIEAQKQTSVSVYEILARYCDEQCSKAIVGQTLTADTGGGSYAQSKTHNDVRHDLTVADCKAIAATLQDDLIRPLVLFNFGIESRLPSIHFACEIPEDLKAQVEILKTLVEIGTPIPLPYIYSKFGIPEPQQGEATTTKPQAAQFPLPFKDDLLVCRDTPRQRGQEYQQTVDRISQYATQRGSELFIDSMTPLLELLEDCTTAEEALEALNDPRKVGELLGRMDSPALQQLLADSMLAANLTGRERAHG